MGRWNKIDWPVEKLREWTAAGVLQSEIGRRLGVTQSGVAAAMKRLGIQARQPRTWPVAQIRRWRAAGKDHLWIAARLGCAAQHVTRLCRRFGIETNPTGLRGAKHPCWRGGRMLDQHGYVLLWQGRREYVQEHRLVMERHLGRPLRAGEVVHHKNGKRADNRLSNLHLFPSNADHLRHELAGRCPKWTKAGLERMRAGVLKSAGRRRGIPRRLWTNQKKTARDARPSRGTKSRPTA